ncbi:MAG TPA: heavy metal-associated domain-containing protein [Planctomycetota bacterium]|nr:heavy metal-associated domain-containing protein [Planctomycetota bacterium]
MRKVFSLFLCMASLALALRAADDKPAEPVTLTYRITGLFCPEREADLRKIAEKIADYKLVAVNYEKAEVTFTCEPGKIAKNAKPDQVRQQVDNWVRQASNHTFGLSPLIADREKLTKVELKVGMLDCKACAFGVYGMVTKVEGVEQATVNMKDGHVVAWINPEKTNRAAIAALLKQREVKVKD